MLLKIGRFFSTARLLQRQALRDRSSKAFLKPVADKKRRPWKGSTKSSWNDRSSDRLSKAESKLLHHSVSHKKGKVDFAKVTNNSVAENLKKSLLSLQIDKTSAAEDKLKQILAGLAEAATKVKEPLVSTIADACPAWNPLNTDFGLEKVLERYERQVFEEIDYKVPRSVAAHQWANLTDYFGFCVKTRIFPAAKVIRRAHDELVAINMNTSEYMFMKITKEYMVDGFLRYYASLVEANQPMVVQSRWKKIDLSRPESMFPFARAIPRKVYLHIGPTNSGKTYQALQRFQQAENAFYAGPLRLLAREVYSRMKSSGRACNLITGEEVITESNADGSPAGLASGTIEMISMNKDLDVAVIDEIQMIEDRDRGWAWTQAFLGVRAKELHLCGDANTETIINQLVKLTGDELVIKRYERLSPLYPAKRHLTNILNELETGDCIVFFSKKELIKAKEEIEFNTGHKCAIIYGSLPAATRAQQALAFNDPNSEYRYLVASDAIGMGLNLAIKRVIFSRTEKFNGRYLDKIPIAQVKQIAGRAGRFHVAGHTGSAGDEPLPGEVTAITRKDLRYIKECLKTNSPLVVRAGLFPPEDFLRDYANSIGPRMPFHRILAILARGTRIGEHFFLTDMSDMIETAELFADIPGLMLEEKIVLAKAPVLGRAPEVKDAFRAFCQVIAQGESKTLADISDTNISYLAHAHISDGTDTLEGIHRIISLYIWLSYRFPHNFLDIEGAQNMLQLCETRIDGLLTGKNNSVFRRKDPENEDVSGANSALQPNL